MCPITRDIEVKYHRPKTVRAANPDYDKDDDEIKMCDVARDGSLSIPAVAATSDEN